MKRQNAVVWTGLMLALGCSVPTPGAGGGVVGKDSTSSSSSSSGGSSGGVTSGDPGSSSSGGGTVTSGDTSGTTGGNTSSDTSGTTSSGGTSGETSGATSSGGMSGDTSGTTSGTTSSSGGPALEGDTCDTAVDLNGVELLSNQTTVGMTSNFDGTDSQTCWGGRSPDRVFTIQVPDQKRLTVDAIPADDFDVALNLLLGPASRCGQSPYECLDGVDHGGAGDLETVRFSNGTGTTQTVFVIVEGYMGAVGQFSLRVNLADVLPGDVCASATPLLPGLTENQTTVGFTNNNDFSSPVECRGGDAPDRVYRVEVPAQQRLSVTAVPDANFDIVLNLVDGPEAACDSSARTCLTAADVGGNGDPETVGFTNRSDAPRTLFLLVDGAVGTLGTFSLNVTVGPAPMGSSCNQPDTLTLPANITGSTMGMDNGLSPHRSCTGYTNDGPEHIYTVEIPANSTLHAQVYPVGSWDPALYILPGGSNSCAATPLVCLTGADQVGADQVGYANTSSQPRQVFVVVDRAYGSDGAYSLQVSVSP